jgi:SMC interacting uncharacterized protein involved in chromosome segregation
MQAARLQDALERLTVAIRDVESELAAMKAEHDPLASHIFVRADLIGTSRIRKAESAAR